jgi:hypothetical protein
MHQKAVELAEANGWFLARQFETDANAGIHEPTTAPEVINDFKGERIDYFVAGYGTGRTVTGGGSVGRVSASGELRGLYGSLGCESAVDCASVGRLSELCCDLVSRWSRYGCGPATTEPRLLEATPSGVARRGSARARRRTQGMPHCLRPRRFAGARYPSCKRPWSPSRRQENQQHSKRSSEQATRQVDPSGHPEQRLNCTSGLSGRTAAQA